MEGWSCAACEQVNPFGMPFCGACGIRDEVERDLWGCRSCGQLSGEAMVFCGRCGQRRGESRPEDLRLVTSLFADISGFTTLADTLDVEDLHAVINPLIAGLAGIAERYDGFVAKYAGDALLCLFGAPTQHEDDAQRALLAALEMQASLPTLLASLGPVAKDLTIHVGVNTGKVVAGAVGSAAQNDYSVLGDSVILAQRLESVCPAGQTYVGESTRELCKDEFDFEDVGELQLKGKLTTVRAFRLVGRRRAGTDASRPLVGRDAELEAILTTLERSGAAVLVGEPGVGKSRLLAEVRVRATAGGHRWLPMRCLSYGAGLPYWPFVDLLRQALGLRIEDPVEEVLARLGSTLPPELVGGAARLLGRPVDELEPEAARRQVHDALAGMLGVLSGGRPLVLAVEDTHWIDSASAEVLGELVRTPGSVPLGVVLTCREEGAASARALVSEALVSCEVPLLPLGPEAVPLVAAGALGRSVGPALAEVLLARTHGNPLFVEELARSLFEDDALVPTVAGLELRPGYDVDALPDTVERVFAARIDALPLAATSVLLIVAVIGRVVRLSLLDAVARGEGTDLDPLEDLVAAGLLERVVEQDEPAVAFHHALLHDAVYGRLLKKQRRVLHRRVADAGRALYGDGDETIDLLARHLYLAEAGEEAVSALLRAGRRAARLYANDAASEHLARAVEVLRELGRDSDDVALELTQVLERRGALEDALVGYQQHAAHHPDAASAHIGRIAVLRALGRYEEAVRAYLVGLDAVGATSPNAAGIWSEGATTLSAQGRFSDAMSLLRTALKLTPAHAHDVRGRLLTQLAHAEEKLGLTEAACDHAADAVALLDRAGALNDLVKALRVHGAALLYAERWDEAARELERAHAVATQIGRLDEAAGAVLNLGLMWFERGDYARAAEGFRAAMGPFDRLGIASGRALSYGNLADALSRLGELDEADGWAVRALALAGATGNSFVLADATRTRARIAGERGNLSVAHEMALLAAIAFDDIGSPGDAADCRELAATYEPSRHEAAPAGA